MNDKALTTLLMLSFVAAAAPVLHRSAQPATDSSWGSPYQAAGHMQASFAAAHSAAAQPCPPKPVVMASTYLGAAAATLAMFDWPVPTPDDACHSTVPASASPGR